MAAGLVGFTMGCWTGREVRGAVADNGRTGLLATADGTGAGFRTGTSTGVRRFSAGLVTALMREEEGTEGLVTGRRFGRPDLDMLEEEAVVN